MWFAGTLPSVPGDFEIITRWEARQWELLGDGPWGDSSDDASLAALYLVLEPMISNGAWPAVFYNRCGWSVPLAARGYRVLGMPECAARRKLALELVDQARRKHPERDEESDEWLSSTLMQAISEEAWDRLDGGWFELVGETTERLARRPRGGE